MLASCPRRAQDGKGSVDAPRFDRFTTEISARLTRRTALGVLAGASLPLLSLGGDTAARKKKKTTLCVNGKTVKAPKKKAKKLLKHGATKGACVDDCGTNQKPCNNTCIPVANCCVASDCTGDDVCENGACVPPRCGNGGPCVVYVSTGIANGGDILTSPKGADNHCFFEVAIIPGLSDRTFKAWIAGDGQTPATRFSNIAAAGPYVLVGNAEDNGNPPPTVADSFQDLIECEGSGPGVCLKHPINRSSSGSRDISPFVWTGVSADGSADPDNCGDWKLGNSQGLVGENANTDASWTASTTKFCDTTLAALYCFEQAT